MGDVKMTLFIGLDGGKAGGISIINEKQEIIELLPMPVIKSTKSKNVYDVPSIVNKLRQIKERDNCFAFLEKAAMFSKGTIAIASTNYCMGMMEGILTSLGISYEIVTPQTWQKEMLSGINVDDTKQASIIFCKRKYPNQIFTIGKCKKEHDGITDSLCIANWGYRRNGKTTS